MLPSPLTEVVDGASEADVIEQAKQSGREALEKMVLRHQSWMYSIAVRMVFPTKDAEEIT